MVGQSQASCPEVRAEKDTLQPLSHFPQEGEPQAGARLGQCESWPTLGQGSPETMGPNRIPTRGQMPGSHKASNGYLPSKAGM